LTSLSNTNVTINDGATFSVPELTDFTPTDGNRILRVNGTGSFLAPQLSNIDNLKIQVYSGGQLALPLVTSYTWNLDSHPYIFQVNGDGSFLDLSALRTINMNTTSSYTIRIYVQANGSIDLSGLESVNTSSGEHFYVYTDAASTLDLSSLTSIDTPGNTTFDLRGGTLNLASMLSLSKVTLYVYEGVTLQLPALTSLVDSSTLTLYAGVTLTLPSLTSLDTAGLTLNTLSDLAVLDQFVQYECNH
jgi:hypothetical protein